MLGESKPDQDSKIASSAFNTTLWTVVLEAGGNSPQSQMALERLCRSYWYPLYAYVRRRGYDEHSAQDLTQEFFRFLIEKNKVQAADRTHGRFRSFLLCMLDNFLTDEWRRSQSQKRGGGATHFSIEAQAAEERYSHEPQDMSTPESVFTQRWAQELVDRVIERLRTEFLASGQGDRFDLLRGFMLDDDSDSQAEIAARLGMTESAVKSALYRMRQRYSELFREEVANTVANPNEVDVEIRDLISALG